MKLKLISLITILNLTGFVFGAESEVGTNGGAAKETMLAPFSEGEAAVEKQPTRLEQTRHDLDGLARTSITTGSSYDPSRSFLDWTASSISKTYTHEYVINFLEKRNTSTPKHYQVLYDIATTKLSMDNGLTLHYLSDSNEIYRENPEKFLFHGTKSTLEIIKKKELKAYRAKCGRYGIFFGRTYNTSAAYASDHSSNINRTHGDIPVRSILVFHKKPSVLFESCDSGMFGTVKEYLLREGRYSIENLHSIVFTSEKDFLDFVSFYEGLPEGEQDFLRTINYYYQGYKPLSIEGNRLRFEEHVRALRSELSKDPYFLIEPFCRRHSDFKEDAALSLLQILRQSEFDLKLFSSLIYIAINNGYTEIIDQVFEFLSAEQLVASFLLNRNCFDSLTPLELAVNMTKKEVLEKFIIKVESSEDKDKLKEKIVDLILTKHNKDEENILFVENSDEGRHILDLLRQSFTGFDALLPILGESIIELELEDDHLLFQRFFEANLEQLNATGAVCELALRAATLGRVSTLRYLSEQSPQSLDVLNERGESPLFLVTKKVDFENFVHLWHLSKTHRMKSATEGGRATIAHRALDNADIKIIEFICKEAPDLLRVPDCHGSNCFHELSRRHDEKSLDKLKFLIGCFPGEKIEELLKLENRWGFTSAMTAARQGNLEGFKILVKTCPEAVTHRIASFIEESSYISVEIRRFLAESFPDNLSLDAKNNLVP